MLNKHSLYSNSRLLAPRSQKGEVNILVVMVVFLLLATVTLGSLSIYYISQYNRAQSTVDQQADEAAATAKIEQKQADEAEFAERLKEPYRTYQAPSVLGNIKIGFPKTWNVYAAQEGDSSQLDLYFSPDIVRDKQNFSGAYSLRVTLEQKLYTEVVDDLLGDIEGGTLVAEPIKVSGITGTKYQGAVTDNKQGVKVVIPIRDKTFSIWTESFDYASDFNKIVSSLQISP